MLTGYDASHRAHSLRQELWLLRQDLEHCIQNPRYPREYLSGLRVSHLYHSSASQWRLRIPVTP